MPSTATVARTTLTVPPEVFALAKEQSVDAYLPAMAKVLREVFWDAETLSVTAEEDPEIADLRSIQFTAEGTWSKEDARQRRQDWNDRTLAICPTTLICTFRLSLKRGVMPACV